MEKGQLLWRVKLPRPQGLHSCASLLVSQDFREDVEWEIRADQHIGDHQLLGRGRCIVIDCDVAVSHFSAREGVLIVWAKDADGTRLDVEAHVTVPGSESGRCSINTPQIYLGCTASGHQMLRQAVVASREAEFVTIDSAGSVHVLTLLLLIASTPMLP